MLLSLALPGLGHIYARTWRRGLQIVASAIVLSVVGREITRIWRPSLTSILALVAVSLTIVGLYLWTAIDAGLQARRRLDKPRARWLRSAWITALVVIGAGWALDLGLPIEWRTFSIPSVSMAPTLRAGDYIALKLTGSATDARRGDVVTFITPRQGDSYVKRVIGVAGDRVSVQAGQVVLNGTPLPLRDDGILNIAEYGTDVLARRFVETVPDGRHYTVAKTTSLGPANNMPEFQIRPGTLFVMGDNRDNSLDSRFAGEFREISTANLIGRGGMIFWSRDLTRLFTSLN